MLSDTHRGDYRPKSGKTARVWQVADEITNRRGQLASRKEVIAVCEAEGGNANTASTQYSQWKSALKQSNPEQYRTGKPGNVGPVRLAVSSDGRLLIPAELRSAMVLDGSGTVSARVVDGELRVLSTACAIESVQKLIAKIDRGEGSLADELIAERRAEAQKESQK